MISFEDRQHLLGVFPPQLRARANRVLDAPTARDRSEAVLRFGLDAMKHLAALALADYRSDHVGAPELKVEQVIASLRGGERDVTGDRSTPGTWKSLFVMADRAASSPGLFDRKVYNKIKLRETFELELTVEALDDAVSVSADTIGRLLNQRLARTSVDDKKSWFAGWDLLVSYRNHWAHDDVYHWLDLYDFYDVVPPILEAAVVATFLHPAIVDVLEQAPIWQLTRVEDRSGGFVHHFVQEPKGKNLRMAPLTLNDSLLDRWAHPLWRATIGSQFVMREAQSGTPEPLLFVDLLSGALPEPLPEASGCAPPEPFDDGQDTAKHPHAQEDAARAPDHAPKDLENAGPTVAFRPAADRGEQDEGDSHATEARDGPSEAVAQGRASDQQAYLSDLPLDVREQVARFLDRVAEAGGILRWEGYPRVNVPSTGRDRIVVSLEPGTWYLQVRAISGYSTEPATRAITRLRLLPHTRINEAFPSYAWRKATPEGVEQFLAIALEYVRDLRSEELKLAPAQLWWVNQGSTYVDERSAGYVFAPRYARNGLTVPHWETLTRLERGHTIVHYAKGSLRSLSQVREPYRVSERPIARSGFDSGQPGYLVRVAYHDATAPIALDEIPVEWRSKEGGPFTHSGRVRQGYLFPLSEAFKRRFVATFGNRWSAVTVTKPRDN